MAAVVAFAIEGLNNGLVNPLGPVHEKLTPGVAELAAKVNVPPLQRRSGKAEAFGVSGGFGSLIVNGPAGAHVQLLTDTVMFA